MKRIIFVFVLLFFAAGLGFSADFGLLLSQKADIENETFTYTSGFTPWYSYNSSAGLQVYLSASLSLKYISFKEDSDANDWFFIPEISLFSLKYKINQALSFEAGRQNYSDILGFSASGLFDGLRFFADTSVGTFSAGMFYTGLLYKETARIIMTGNDMLKFYTPLDWDKFGDTYFASSRAFMTIRWDMPVGKTANLSAEVLGQFDLNNKEEKINSQYVAIKHEFYPLSMMRVTAGGLFEAMQNNDGDFAAAFGGLAQIKAGLPTPLDDWLGATVKFTSGAIDDTLIPFTPLVSITQGEVFPGDLQGLALIGVDYEVKIIKQISASCAFKYFICTHGEKTGADGNNYGAEAWASFIWQPLDDLRAVLGGGVFLPGLGNFYPDDTDVMYKISIGLSLAL